MIKNFKFTSILMAVVIVFLTNVTVFADEGTDDADFDYLAPEEASIFLSMKTLVNKVFRPPSHAKSYASAKRRLYSRIKDEQTFYCACPTNLKLRTFDEQSCGYLPRNDNKRAHRLEAEHILPASWIAKFHPGETCWVADKETCGSSRQCCLKNDARFKTAHNDLVNLIPTIGELNADRSNYIYSEINGEVRNYGVCDFEVKSSKRYVEPKEDTRGDIARVYFYMSETYALVFPENLKKRLDRWNSEDPISEKEIKRNKSIKKTQGTANHFVSD